MEEPAHLVELLLVVGGHLGGGAQVLVQLLQCALNRDGTWYSYLMVAQNTLLTFKEIRSFPKANFKLDIVVKYLK